MCNPDGVPILFLSRYLIQYKLIKGAFKVDVDLILKFCVSAVINYRVEKMFPVCMYPFV